MTTFGYTNLKDNEPDHEALKKAYENRMRIQELQEKVTEAGMASVESGEIEIFTFEGVEMGVLAEPYQWTVFHSQYLEQQVLEGTAYKMPDHYYDQPIGGLLKFIHENKSK